MFSTETNPDFKKQNGWCFICFCMLQQSFLLLVLVWFCFFFFFFLVSYDHFCWFSFYQSWLRVFILWLRWWSHIIIIAIWIITLFTYRQTRNCITSFGCQTGLYGNCSRYVLHSDERLTSSPVKSLPFSEIMKFFDSSSGAKKVTSSDWVIL